MSSIEVPAGPLDSALRPAPPYDPAPIVRFDTFLFVAAGTVLATRAYLASTGYPKVGGAHLHIAHVLWGGLLLALAVVIMLVTVTSPARLWASVIGGVGFGLFIDEVGKFVSKDVNYFYRPAVAIIYVVLLLAYLVGRAVLTRLTLTGPRVRAIGAVAVADDQLGVLTGGRRASVLAMLERSQPRARAVPLIRLLNQDQQGRNSQRRSVEEWLALLYGRVNQLITGLVNRRWISRIIFSLMTLQATLSLIDLIVVLAVRYEGATLSERDKNLALSIGLGVQSALMLAGLIMVAVRRRRPGLELIRASLFVALLYTTLMEFAVDPVGGVTDFVAVAILLTFIGAEIKVEESRSIATTSAKAETLGQPDLESG